MKLKTDYLADYLLNPNHIGWREWNKTYIGSSYKWLLSHGKIFTHY